MSVDRKTKKFWGPLSQTVCDTHEREGVSCVSLADGREMNLEDEDLVLLEFPGFDLSIEGRQLQARRHVRAWLFNLPEWVKDDPNSAVVTVWDEEEGKSRLTVMTAANRHEMEETPDEPAA